MPKATPRDIAKSVEEHYYKIPAKFDRIIDRVPSEPESESQRIERDRYWRSLRKKIQAGARIRDGRLIGFTNSSNRKRKNH